MILTLGNITGELRWNRAHCGQVKVVQKPLGHKTAAMTLDRYGHLYADDLDGVAAAFDTAADTTADRHNP
jgi:integrase